MGSPFEESRARVAPWLLVASILAVVPILLAARTTGTSPLPLVLLSIVASLGAALAYRSDLVVGRAFVAIASVLQLMLLTAALKGHFLQIPAQMFHFAALAAIAAMVDHRALLWAGGSVALHHVAFALYAPEFLFGPLADIPGSTLATSSAFLIAVGGVTFVAAWVNRTRLGLVADAMRKQQEARDARADAEAAEERTSEALREMKIALAETDAARAEAEDALRRGREEARRAEDLDEALTAQRVEQERRWAGERAAQDAAMDIIRTALGRMACGDLTPRLSGTLPESYADIGVSFDETLESLDQALCDIRRVSGTISQETADIAAAAAELSRRTERQTSSLEEITTSTDRLTETIRGTAEDAGEAEAVMMTTGAEAQTGAQVMEQAIEAMAEIQGSAREVRKITTMIEDIAFQTNLLALNAGVEAARAGNAGRGFAVVASEVRALAKRSSDAARGINGLIEASGEQIERGVQLVHDTSGALEAIIAAVQAAAARISRIATTSDAQTMGVDGINSALRDLERVSQQNATMFEETTLACQTLRTGAHGLSEAIRNFGVVETSDGARRRSTEHAA